MIQKLITTILYCDTNMNNYDIELLIINIFIKNEINLP